MKAPDRIWLNIGSSHVVVINGKKSTSRLAFEEKPNNEDLPEYVRKGAFPVEEIRDSTMFQLAAASEQDWCKETHKLYRLLTRILSLLEGANGGMGDE